MSDPHAYGPVYRRIAAELRKLITSGRLAPGDPVPTEPALMEQYGVARGTARSALDVLRQEGLIITEHGRGSFVRPRPRLRRRSTVFYDRKQSLGSPTARMIEDAGGVVSWDHDSKRTTADETVAARLGIAVGDPVMRTEYVYKSDGLPFKLATSWEPLLLTTGSPIEWPEDGAAVGVVVRFDIIGIRITETDEVVSKRPPVGSEASVLGVPSGEEVLTIDRTYRAGELIVEVADIVAGPGYELHYGIPVR